MHLYLERERGCGREEVYSLIGTLLKFVRLFKSLTELSFIQYNLNYEMKVTGTILFESDFINANAS